MRDTIYVGDDVQLIVTVRDVDGTLTAPTTLALIVDPPTGASTVKAKADMENPSTGVYYFMFPAAVSGVHSYSFESGGNVNKYDASVFEVAARPPIA